jgi:hypothetical protein
MNNKETKKGIMEEMEICKQMIRDTPLRIDQKYWQGKYNGLEFALLLIERQERYEN